MRRFLTRAIAIVPAVIVILITGDDGTYLLVWSQVILSIQLPFAMIPLIRITGHKSMGSFRNGWIITIIGWIFVMFVAALNVWLLVDLIIENALESGVWLWILIGVGAFLFIALLVLVTFWPLKPKESPYHYRNVEEEQLQQEQTITTVEEDSAVLEQTITAEKQQVQAP